MDCTSNTPEKRLLLHPDIPRLQRHLTDPGLQSRPRPPVATSIAATGGTPQNETVNITLATALQATVTDQNGNPLGGATVTFSARQRASGTFTGNLTTVMVDDQRERHRDGTVPSRRNGNLGSYAQHRVGFS